MCKGCSARRRAAGPGHAGRADPDGRGILAGREVDVPGEQDDWLKKILAEAPELSDELTNDIAVHERVRGESSAIRAEPAVDLRARLPGPTRAIRPPTPAVPLRRPGAHRLQRVRMGLVTAARDPAEDDRAARRIERELEGSWSLRRFPSYAALVEALVEEDIELAWLPPVAYIRACRLGDVHLVLTFERAGQPSYGSALLAAERASVGEVRDVAGKRVAWVDVWSAAGYLVPRDMLRAAGVDPASAFASQAFVGSHAAVLDALEEGRVDVGATYCSLDTRGALVAGPWTGRRGLRALAVSDPIPGDTLCAAGHLSPEEARLLVDPLVELSLAESGPKLLRALFGADRFVQVDPAFYEVLERALEDDLRR
jgi:phosphate/phosphite/phosphonate ABC transporter binding protein